MLDDCDLITLDRLKFDFIMISDSLRQTNLTIGNVSMKILILSSNELAFSSNISMTEVSPNIQ